MDSRCLLTPYIIQSELEALAGLPHKSTTLIHAYDAIRDEIVYRWNVRPDYLVALARVPAEDLRLSLDAFSRKYCEPAVKVLREWADCG